MGSPSPPYLTQDDLTNAWGAEAMRQFFDDANTNTINAAAVALIISRASARTSAWLPNTYDGTLPLESPFPEMIFENALEYAAYLTMPRNPDYFRALGWDADKLLARADALGKLIQAGVLRLVDAANPVPDNVGGDVESNDPNIDFRPKRLVFIRSMGDF